MHLTSLTKTPRGLEIRLIVPPAEAREELRPDDTSDDQLATLIEHQLCNGWEWIAPHEIAALTEAPILSDDVTRDDQGNLLEIGDVFWFPDYMIVDPVEVLFRDGVVIFQGAPENAKVAA